MEQLKNYGIQTIGSNKNIKNIIVVGIARSGTSLIAGLLDKLGIFTGKKSVSPVFEDVYLAEAMEKKDFKTAKKIIEEYNKEYSFWAFKRPSIVNFLKEMHNLWENPYYIFIFKDIVSIANRNKISMEMDFLNNLIHSYYEMGKIISFVEQHNINGMFLSYEKIILNPEKFVDEFSALLKLDVKNKNDIIEFIKPNPEEYLDKTRVNKTVGTVDLINKNIVTGWIKYLYKKDPVKVGLYVNGELIEEVTADKYRKDLEGKVHPTGKCGFVFELKDLKLKPTDKIEIKAKNDFPLRLGKKALEFFIKGNVDKIKKHTVSGWALDYREKDSVKVGLYVNGELIEEVTADKYRKDLEGKVHPTGKCGFVFELKDLKLKPTDKIEIKAKNDFPLRLGKKALEFFVTNTKKDKK